MEEHKIPIWKNYKALFVIVIILVAIAAINFWNINKTIYKIKECRSILNSEQANYQNANGYEECCYIYNEKMVCASMNKLKQVGKNPMLGNCYDDKAILLKQYFGSTGSTNGGDCTASCLFMDVYLVFKQENKTYYFADEHILRNDLKEGNSITITWCYLSEEIGYRIKKVMP
jgi:hypothetical protein